ncbi:sensor histidine kinase [Paenibacillus sp. IHBB 3054]|uniref:sensor histidine kinase n=1 Tax=Paenibacillus sp. IHBB 3054 TaxID=3425689 RepID=UPI003F67F85A
MTVLVLLISLMLAVLLAIVLAFRLLRLHRELNHVHEFLLNKTTFTEPGQTLPNERVRTFSENPILRKLASSINSLLDRLQNAESRTRQAEDAHKRLVSNISHDLRTPLTSVMGYLEVLQTDENLSGAEQKQFMNIAYKKSRSMYELLDQFFQLAKIEAGDLPLQNVPIDMNRLTKEMLVGLYPIFLNLSLEPVVEIPEKRLYALGDSMAVERIVGNLLSNSLRHGASSGKIGARLTETEDHISLEIWDNGPGISPGNLKLIFERTYTLEPARTSGSSGSGLGLTIARQLALKQGGSLHAASIPGERTSFILQLPKASSL